ncbi:MAG: toll/interleukin-1 receptor domain-containing protein [Dehalococcoidia bacterium]|nr:toll/interleukin-1 receptor domain-containing protein [Dehalococcoidia bacterium]
MAAPEYDVFICHASEDKEPFVRDLRSALEADGVKVWIDEVELVLGSRLRETIDKGLGRSRFGVVVLSHHFFLKRWPQQELDGLLSLEAADGRTRVLPIWHDVSQTDVARYSPVLADRVAVESARGLTDVVAEILRALAIARKASAETPNTRTAYGKLKKLHAGPQVNYFLEVLGNERFRTPYQSHPSEPFLEYVWVDPQFYVQAAVNSFGSVLLFTVTSRSLTFTPVFEMVPEPSTPSRSIRLCQDSFEALDPEPPRRGAFFASMGARLFGYWEARYYGNPGNYQTFILGVNQAGALTEDDVSNPFGPQLLVLQNPETDESAAREALQTVRRHMPNTFGATAPYITLDRIHTPIGVTFDQVRTAR